MGNQHSRLLEMPIKILAASLLAMSAVTTIKVVHSAGEPRTAHRMYVNLSEEGEWAEIGSGSASGGGISNNGGDSWDPAIVIDPDGAPLIAWADRSSGGSQIYIRRWQDQSWEEIGENSASAGGISNTSGDSWDPSLAIGTDGIPHIAWGVETNMELKIYARRWDGESWAEIGVGSATGDGVSSGSGDSWSPSMAVGPDGMPVIAWAVVTEEDSEIYVRGWNGSSWVEIGSGSATGGGISNNSGGSGSPSLAISPDGSPIVAWADGTSGNLEIYVRRWDGTTWAEIGSGSATGGGISNNSGASRSLSLAIDHSGFPIIAWQDGPSNDSSIYVRRWDGTKWAEIGSGSATGAGISSSDSNSVFPTLSVSPEDETLIAWQELSDDNSQIYVRRWDGDSWIEIGTGSASGGGISNNSGESQNPSAAFGHDGIPIVTWADESDDEQEIYVRQWKRSSFNTYLPGIYSEG